MATPLIPQDDFNEITQLIHAARQRAVQAVNTALIELYWQVGQFISRKLIGDAPRYFLNEQQH